MKIVWSIVVLLIMLTGCITNNNTDKEDWKEVTSGVSAELNGIDFINENEGWIAGIGVILHTTDGGTSWAEQTVPTRANLSDVYFLDANNGWACGGEEIFKTTDGGDTWVLNESQNSNTLFRLTFTDADHGYAVGISNWPTPVGGLLQQTSDGGMNWESEYFVDPEDTLNGQQYIYDLNDVHFPTLNTGYIVGGSDWFLKTTDSGINWQDWSDNAPDNFCRGIFFINDNIGWTVGSAGSIHKTIDGGLTWSNQFNLNHTLYKVFFIDENTGWACGLDGYIVHTNDGGANWEVQYDENIASGGTTWKDIFFVNENLGFVVGTDGKILRYIPQN